MEDLDNWKNNLTNTENKILYVVPADVQGLYPNLCQELIKASLSNALQKCTKYIKEVSKILINLTILSWKYSS